MTDGLALRFHGLEVIARPSGALWWPGPGWLIVADLHLGKSERMARRGGALLPPYETRLTLERLTHEIAALAPRRVISLGDGFDDLPAAGALPPPERAALAALARGRSWLWISGNHDSGPLPPDLPGRVAPALSLGNVTLRHEADPADAPDISGHFHPAARLGGERRPAFLIGTHHLILPAFGAYTGGLDARAPALGALIPQGIAAVCRDSRVLAVPLR